MTSIRQLRDSLTAHFRRDDGVAVPAVLFLSLIMLIMVSGSLSVATSGLRKADTDQDYNGALAAAYAGVEEYQSRLSNDATYQKYGNPAAPFTTGTGSTVSLPVSPNVNPAFGVGATGSWADVPGVDADGNAISTGASYRYEVDNSDYQDKGVLHLRSTGRVGTVTRSLVADLKQDGFIDYLYFTNYEVQDPAYSGSTTAVDPTTLKSVCERYAYAVAPSPTRPAACGAPSFTPFDDFHGPVRSNDKIIVCKSTFEGSVTTSAPGAVYSISSASGCANADFQVGGKPVFGDTIDMPPTNTQMIKETRNDLTADVPRPGCLYTGPTQITFLAGGKMNVISPWTIKTNTAATKAGATNPIQCGTPGTGTNGLGSVTGATIDVIDTNLIYVQTVPAVGANDANAPSSSAMPSTNFTCTAAVPASNTPPGWAFKNGSTYVARYPAANEVTPGGASTLVHYGCRAGDLYVKGTMSGKVTLASDNYIYVTGDLTYVDRSADMLGLVGQNAVLVWNPVNSSGSSILGGTNREIDGAILSVGHTFQVQNFDVSGPRGTLTVFGAIAQKFRGTVVTFSGSSISSGYGKDYQYDKRFRNAAPPKFLTPVSTTYGVTQYATVPAAFLYTGVTGP